MLSIRLLSWAVNGGYSVRGLGVLAGLFNEAGALFWAAVSSWSFSVPVTVPGLPETQPVIPWLAVVASSLLQVSVLWLKLSGRDIPPHMLVAAILLSLYDYGTTGIEPVYVPVSETSMPANTGVPVSAPAGRAGADIDAPNGSMDNGGWELPRVSRHISDGELIVLLAALRASSGKHRFSANQIAALVGGSRNAVRARVKEIRSSAPAVVFRPLAPEQQQLREQLQLDQR